VGLIVEEQCEQNDDRDRHAKQPEKNAATHDRLLWFVSHVYRC